MMEEIPFQHFYVEIKSKLKDIYLFRAINPYTRFFKLEDLYLSTTAQNDVLIIELAVGKVKLQNIHEIIELAKNMNIKEIQFFTSDTNFKVQSLAEHFKCELVSKIKDFYGQGTLALHYRRTL
jgi:hypothetical protein